MDKMILLTQMIQDGLISDATLDELANALGQNIYPLVGQEILSGDRVIIGNGGYDLHAVTHFKGTYDSVTITALDILDNSQPITVTCDVTLLQTFYPEDGEASSLIRIDLNDGSLIGKNSRLKIDFVYE